MNKSIPSRKKVKDSMNVISLCSQHIFISFGESSRLFFIHILVIIIIVLGFFQHRFMVRSACILWAIDEHSVFHSIVGTSYVLVSSSEKAFSWMFHHQRTRDPTSSDCRRPASQGSCQVLSRAIAKLVSVS